MQADGKTHTNRNNKFHAVLFRREEVVCVRAGGQGVYNRGQT